MKTNGLFEQKPNERTINRGKLRRKLCYQNPLRTFQIKSQARYATKHGSEKLYRLTNHQTWLYWRAESRPKKVLHRKNSFWTLNQKNSRANEHKQLDQSKGTIISVTKLTSLIFQIRKRKRNSPMNTATGEPTRRFWTSLKKQDKNLKTLRLKGKRQKLTKPGKLWFKFDSNLKRKLWVPRRPDKRGGD